MKKESLLGTQDNRNGNTGKKIMVANAMLTTGKKEKDAGSASLGKLAIGNSPRIGIKGYEEFLIQPKSTSRKQTYIGCSVYSQLNNILPIIGNGISIPTFLNNVLEHHLRTYKNEIEVLFHNRVQKIEETASFTPKPREIQKFGNLVRNNSKDYKNSFLIRCSVTQRRQTYINCDLYAKLNFFLPVLDKEMSIPTFLNNMLEHHLKTYKGEIEELFHEKIGKLEL